MFRRHGQLALCAFLFLTGWLCATADSKILIIGSNTDGHQGLSGPAEPAFRSDELTRQLEQILQGSGRGDAVLAAEDRYQSGRTVIDQPVEANNLLTWYHWPYSEGGQTARWQKLRGEAGTAWDYVVLIGDPFTIKHYPGVYAQGVASIAAEVARGSAQTVLLTPWPAGASDAEIAHFEGVVARTAHSLGLPVAPAARAWQAAGIDHGETHPPRRGAYLAAATLYSTLFQESPLHAGHRLDRNLAAIAHATAGEPPSAPRLNEPLDWPSPFALLGDQRRVVHFSHKGTSTERDLRRAIVAALESLGIDYEWEPFEKLRGQLYDSNTPADDGLGWPLDAPLPIAFNQGRHPDYVSDGEKGYVTNPDVWQLGFAFNYQWRTGQHSVQAANDHYVAKIHSADLDMATRLIGAESIDRGVGGTARAIPKRALWAEIVKHHPDERYQRDRTHLNRGLLLAAGAYVTTLYSGRTPVVDPGVEALHGTGDQVFDRFCQKIGYEMAWRMGRVQGRAPGFRVRPVSGDPDAHTETFGLNFINPPQHPVHVLVSLSDPEQGTLSANQLTFTPENYETIQTVSLTRSAASDGRGQLRIGFSTASKDPVYESLVDIWEVRAGF
jgi:hypothetical protein